MSNPTKTVIMTGYLEYANIFSENYDDNMDFHAEINLSVANVTNYSIFPTQPIHLVNGNRLKSMPTVIYR